jgi:hypothetical protein
LNFSSLIARRSLLSLLQPLRQRVFSLLPQYPLSLCASATLRLRVTPFLLFSASLSLRASALRFSLSFSTRRPTTGRTALEKSGFS